VRVVCDEGVPRALARRLRILGIDVSPLPPQWRGLSNGRLIGAVAAAGYDVLLSNDKNIIFQLNIATLKIAVVTLPTNRRQSVVPRSEDIASTLRSVLPGQHISIELNGGRTLRWSGSEGAIFADEMPPVAPFDP
jgi:hypothetical protein